MATSLRVKEERPVDLWRTNTFSDLRGDDSFFSHMGLGFGRLFDDFFGGGFLSRVVPETGGMYSPRIDVKETKNAVKIAAEMPGIDGKDIDVSVHDGMLTISGEKKVEKEDDELGYHRIERSYGCFTRDISLPDAVETGKIEAKFKNGVLNVTLPKTEKAIEKSKKIPLPPDGQEPIPARFSAGIFFSADRPIPVKFPRTAELRSVTTDVPSVVLVSACLSRNRYARSHSSNHLAMEET